LRARLAYTMELLNILVLWDGLPAHDDNILHFSLTEFAL
jgi:hypothetical protein